MVGVQVFAAPPVRAKVLRDMSWELHVDFDALGETGIGRQVLASLAIPEQKLRFLLYQIFLAFDPRRGLHDVALDGPSTAPEERVILIHADSDADKLVETAEMAEDHRTVSHGTNTVNHWVDTDRREKIGGDPRTFAASHQGES